MKSQVFFTDAHKEIAGRVQDLLNAHRQFLSPLTVESTRAVGDAIAGIVASSFASILGDMCVEYSAGFSRRAMADLAFKGPDGFHYVVDVKTHRTDTKFNMPNLTSVERLAHLYEDDRSYFALLMVSYHVERARPVVTKVRFVPIEFLGWDCLTIGSLGRGQIQIANANRITVNLGYPRRQWMLEFCDALLEFYPRQMARLEKCGEEFRAIRASWLARSTD